MGSTVVGSNTEAPQPLSEAAEAEGVRAAGCAVADALDDHFSSLYSVSAEGNAVLSTHPSYPCWLAQKQMIVLNDHRFQFHPLQTDTHTDARYHASVRIWGSGVNRVPFLSPSFASGKFPSFGVGHRAAGSHCTMLSDAGLDIFSQLLPVFTKELCTPVNR